MVWTAMILLDLVACVFCAVAAAQRAKLGPGGYALAIGVAVLVGIANGWGMNRVADIFHRRTKDQAEQVRERYIRLLYLAAAVWCFVPPLLIIVAAERLLAPLR